MSFKQLNAGKALSSGKGWVQMPRDVYNNWFGEWPAGTTIEYKQEYRFRVVVLCALTVVLIPVALVKLYIIATDDN